MHLTFPCESKISLEPLDEFGTVSAIGSTFVKNPTDNPFLIYTENRIGSFISHTITHDGFISKEVVGQTRPAAYGNIKHTPSSPRVPLDESTPLKRGINVRNGCQLTQIKIPEGRAFGYGIYHFGLECPTFRQ
ncbi:MAG: hypothetical protein GF315_01990 [candidate division Zixibacteria bacterium]|nr:hypothetical protein [candidate division Zixibacteria bacterium]